MKQIPTTGEESSSAVDPKMSQDTEKQPQDLMPPFPEYSKGKFHVPAPEDVADIFMKGNYENPATPKPPIRYPAPRPMSSKALIYLDPLAPQLAAQDEIYNKEKHPLLDDILKDRFQAEWEVTEVQDILESHLDARMGHVHVASKRVQAVLGTKNERTFDMPKIFNRGPAQLVEYPQLTYDYGKVSAEEEGVREEQAKALMDPACVVNEGGAVEASASAEKGEDNQKEGEKEDTEKAATVGGQDETQKDNTQTFPPPKNKIEALFRSHFTAKIVAETSSAALRRPFNPSSLLNNYHKRFFGPTVSNLTGAGLREFLLLKGKQGLVRKRECDSITFCDFMPEIVTGNVKSKMLGHWTALREKNEHIEVYEVDLPTSVMNLQTHKEEPKLQTWIWILISRPVVSLSDTDRSTQIHAKPPKASVSTSRTTPYLASRAAAAALPKPAPTFPSPIPESWIAFACPLEQVTAFPERVEDVTMITSSGSFPKSCKRYDLRQDYDFSHGGVPIFEFSSVEFLSTLYPKGLAPKFGTKFLSVEGLGGYDIYDYCGHLAPRVYLDKLQEREENPEKWEKNEYDEDREAPAGLQSPKSGLWWEEFFKRADRDKSIWEDIRSAMGRGKCRVVIRWNEIEGLGREVNVERFRSRWSGESLPKLPRKSKKSAKRNSGSPNSKKSSPRRQGKRGQEISKKSPPKADDGSTIGGGPEAAKDNKPESVEKAKMKVRKR